MIERLKCTLGLMSVVGDHLSQRQIHLARGSNLAYESDTFSIKPLTFEVDYTSSQSAVYVNNYILGWLNLSQILKINECFLKAKYDFVCLGFNL